ncbi:hypothetical protein OIU79_019825 [Salix purpurea]|uniref:Uncharacterized protein n=1 Tax=Salix purpurea TaxID=77065 RepID=A0A9Q0P238_SALPP|nr:hypothetical protein OIU79_019825 [Salix purpurea]
MGMDTLAFEVVPTVRQGLEKKREGVVIRKDRVGVHVGVNRVRNVRVMDAREGSDERVANENMGSMEVGEEEGQG